MPVALFSLCWRKWCSRGRGVGDGDEMIRKEGREKEGNEYSGQEAVVRRVKDNERVGASKMEYHVDAGRT